MDWTASYKWETRGWYTCIANERELALSKSTPNIRYYVISIDDERQLMDCYQLDENNDEIFVFKSNHGINLKEPKYHQMATSYSDAEEPHSIKDLNTKQMTCSKVVFCTYPSLGLSRACITPMAILTP